MNRILLDSKNIGTFVGPIASKYSYTPALRTRLDEVWTAAKRSDNRHFVLDGAIVRAAQSTLRGAETYMLPSYVLVSVQGCGQPTHVEGTNGGTMPCGANLTIFGKTAPYFCSRCEPNPERTEE